MSTPKYDNDGFRIVTGKKSNKIKTTTVPRQRAEFLIKSDYFDVDKSYERIASAVDVIKDSQYFRDIIKSVSSIIQDREVIELVCFGLGRIGECNISKYQLALLLCLKSSLQPENVLVHDPIFSSQECDLLKRFNLTVIEKNIEGSYVISEQGITFVYLPHCPKQLTNNFLWSNWSFNLKNCILLCNSFNSLVENQLNRVLLETVPYIHKILPYTTEVSLENNFTYKDIFNDTAIHYFLNEKLLLVPSDFWLNQVKPEYNETEEFITSLMIEKLYIV